MDKGFIKLHRKIQDHWLYEEKRAFSKFEAWIDMLLMANHKENKVVLGNELITVERGQFITSIRKLGERWGWSNTKVTNFLEILKRDEMITYKKDTKKTVITIVNYGIYHDSENTKTTRERHDKDTKATREHTNKNEKNVKNDKEDINTFTQIENLRQRYSEKQRKALDDYFEMLRHTRVSAKISESVILKTYQEFDKYPPICVEYAVRTHTDNPQHHSKKENYTIGIARNTTSEEAYRKLNQNTKQP